VDILSNIILHFATLAILAAEYSLRQ